MKRLAKWTSRPKFIRRVNGWFTVVWLALVLPTVLVWSRSILWVAVLSIWANVISHYNTWLTARVEVREEHVEEFFPPDPEEPRVVKSNKKRVSPGLPIGL